MEVKPDHLTNFVRVYDNVCDHKFLKRLYKYAEKKPSFCNIDQSSIVGNAKGRCVDRTIRDCTAETLSPFLKKSSMTNVFISHKLITTFKKYMLQYLKDCGIFDLFGSTVISDLTLLRYPEGGHYKRHIDSGTTVMRTLSLIYMINDNFEGGEVEFSAPTNENLKSIVKPKENRLIIFPSNFLYPHRVLPVKNNNRYTVVAWTK